jgi:uncharacterized protein YpuA (DUF1002 family)
MADGDGISSGSGGHLRGEGVPVQSSDQAISSVALVCGTPGSGLEIQTRNITGMPAPEYAGALLTAGLKNASVTIAAPARKPVSGETALVGVFKAFPLCSDGEPLNSERTQLAYAQLKVIADLAADGSDMTRASAMLLAVLHAVIVGEAPDSAGVEAALNSAASEQGITLDDNARADLVTLFERLRGVDHGSYAHGYSIQELAQDRVRVVPNSE